MSSIAKPSFLRTLLPGNGINNIHRPSAPSLVIIHRSSRILSLSFSSIKKEKQFSDEPQKDPIPHSEDVTQENRQSDQLQPPDQDLYQQNRFEFGKYVAREAQLDDEYLAAAYMRADIRYEDQQYAETYKMQLVHQEFYDMKRRCNTLEQKCTCILAVRKEDENVKHTLFNSVVGTLDLSIKIISHEQTYSGIKMPLQFIGYISDLSVAKSARRQGIATNMVLFEIKSAKANGAKQVFVHVRRDNEPALELYRKIGFEVVEEATFALSETFYLYIEV